MKIIELDSGIIFDVRVVPRSSRTEIVGEVEGAVKVRLSSPPVDGAANQELVRVFAKALGVSRSAITIKSGAKSKTKCLRIDGVSAEQFLKTLAGF